MKRILRMLIMMVSLSALVTGCTLQPADLTTGPEQPRETTAPSGDTPAGNGQIEASIPYRVLEEDALTEEMLHLIDGLRQQRGFYYLDRNVQELTLFIGTGEKPSGGYGVEVSEAVKQGNTTVLHITDQSPEPGSMVTEALTYPYIVIVLDAPVEDIVVLDQDGSPFHSIEGPGVSGEAFDSPLFDARRIAPGNQVGSMIVKQVQVQEDATGEGYSAEVVFSGIVHLSGTYEHYQDHELLGNVVAFYVDEASAGLLPQLDIDTRIPWLVFTNYEEAGRLLGGPGTRGDIQVEIDMYTIHYEPSDVYNTALLLGTYETSAE